MTAIVALNDGGHIWMGGDSAGVEPSSLRLTVRRDEKVFINGEFIIGGTTSFRMLNLLRYSFKPPEKPIGVNDDYFMNTVFIDSIRQCFRDGGFASKCDERESGGSFIVGFNKQLYIIQEDYQVGIPLDNFAAVGCGDQVCLGSMYSTVGQNPSNRIITALEAAERHSAGVRGPFVMKDLPPPDYSKLDAFLAEVQKDNSV